MIRRYFVQALSALMLLLLIGAGVGLVLFNKNGGELLSVQTGSMEPVLKTGSVVSVTKVPPESIQIGDIVTFLNPANINQTITHRVVDIVPSAMSGGQSQFVTKGDANQSSDAPIQASSIVGKVSKHVPYVGGAVDFIRNPLGLLPIIYIPAFIIIAGELKRLTAYYRQIRPYSVRQLQPKSLLGAQLAVLVSAAAGLLIFGVAAPTLAQLRGSVTLTGNTISSGPLAPGEGNGNCTITNTAPNSNNVCTINQSTTITTKCGNTATVNSSTSQSATSGTATNENISAGDGSATSGSASNQSTISTNISSSCSTTSQ